MSKKRNIKSFGKTLAYLQDPNLRATETGDARLIVDSMEITGESFEGKTWRNVSFKKCDFIGAYEVKLAAMENCTFEECRFSGIFAWGIQNAVSFIKCGMAGASHLWGAEGSTAVTYQQCTLTGTSADSNQQGSVGTYGEATFIECNGKWFGVFGHSTLLIHKCEFDSMNCLIDPRESNGIAPDVAIRNCKLRGKFDMTSSVLQSLTVRDTVLEELNLSNVTVKEDVVMERVKGNFIHAGVAAARSLTVSNCEILGNDRGVSFLMSMDGAQQVLLERTNFGTQMTSKVNLGPGRPLQANEWSVVPLNKSAVIRNCTFPIMDASWLETQRLQIEGNTIGSLNVSNGRMGKLELRSNTIARSVDFTNTQVKESNVQSFAKGQAKLEGSNIKLN
ncbi:hypothetical protein GmRootV35_16820 [Variovorax sp. V35]